MAKIRNSMVSNVFGEGKEKILTLDNGDEYIIRNSPVSNVFGDGKELEIEKRVGNESASYSWPLFVFPLAALIFLIGLLGIFTTGGKILMAVGIISFLVSIIALKKWGI